MARRELQMAHFISQRSASRRGTDADRRRHDVFKQRQKYDPLEWRQGAIRKDLGRLRVRSPVLGLRAAITSNRPASVPDAAIKKDSQPLTLDAMTALL
ncbi:hypothetical protein EVAR_95000_1 [Eumeta japonica]|uniref:Uncharacterized protein n=1 Tax=Eumeta variegata TaxID=151549 RepID=A0A4C1UUP1_EUMVA|nr:hypothetical protein EVAR_95000_1 [Eumeta japonica]